MKMRHLAALAILPSVFLLPHRGEAATTGSDFAILRAASIQLGHDSRAHVFRWLYTRSRVKTVALGRDGQTVSIGFRDGLRADILPRASHTARVSGATLRANIRTHVPGGARAAVWEPFATELGLGPHAGDTETSALQSAGFSVSQAYDAQVDVALMSTLSQYNVVYMHTHSGVDASGHGVLATGELVNGDPSVAPLMADGSVVVVGVAGSNSNFYAITSTFVRLHLGQFPSNALLFMNGCSLLQSQEFWNALQARGAGVLVSWDQDATAQDDFLSAAAFFNQMNHGLNVHDALQSLYAAGYGKSTYQGQTATLGSLGNSAITLQLAANGQISTPVPTATNAPPATATRTPAATITPRPTATAQPTATHTPQATATNTPRPTATKTPRPTATDVSVSVSAHLVAAVKPGAHQTVDVTSSPNVTVGYRVTFPNGDHVSGTVTTDASGLAQIQFSQPASKITRKRVQATVTLTPEVTGASTGWSQTYAIRFGKIDISVQPRTEAVGKRVTLWVHTASRTAVTYTVRTGTKIRKTLHARTGAKGWASVRYRIPSSLKGKHLVVRVDARRAGRHIHTASSLIISH